MRAKVVDSHQHFWDIQRFEYWWLTPERKILMRNFVVADLEPLAVQVGVDVTIAVQAHPSLEEAHWLLGLASNSNLVAGVVGWVDLTSPSLGHDLDKLQRDPKFKGVRPAIEAESDDAWILRRDVLQGIKEIERRHLPFDLVVWPRHLQYLPRLREECPRLRLIIDHIGLPPIADKGMDGWDRDMETAARLTGVWCKLSGMITRADPRNWQPGDLKPYVDHVVTQFGFERLMFGSDWPICKLAGSYEQVVEALRVVLGPLNERDSARVWGETAALVYNL